MQETKEMQVWSLGQEVNLKEGTAPPSSILALENLMDRGAWQTTAHRITQSWTRLKRLISMHACKRRGYCWGFKGRGESKDSEFSWFTHSVHGLKMQHLGAFSCSASLEKSVLWGARLHGATLWPVGGGGGCFKATVCSVMAGHLILCV